jgi:anti-sigma factor RsiW
VGSGNKVSFPPTYLHAQSHLHPRQNGDRKDLEDHLSSRLIDAYRQQRLQPAELVRADEHLTGCAACRRRLETALSGSAIALYTDLQAAAAPLPDAATSHLTFEQMAKHVDQALDRTESLFVADHLTSCLQCERAVNDLRAFSNEGKSEDLAQIEVAAPNPTLTDATAKPGLWEKVRGLFWPSAPVPAFRLALVALLIVVAGWLIRSSLVPKSPAPDFASQDGQPTVSPSVAPSLAPPVATPQPETIPLLAQLTDGTRQITLDQQGKLSGLEELPPAYQRLVKEALTAQRLPASSSLEGLTRRGSSLMGADEQGNRFALLAPAGKVVFPDRPTFQWTPLGGATSYIVEIYDERFDLVMKSEALQRTQWVPPQPLARGQVYAWQVKATKDGQEVQAPKPPAPQARFRTLAQSQAEEIARARRTYASSHLTLGLLYTQAGLLDEAEQEFRILLKANPNSAAVRRLLAQVQALRR